MKRSVAALVLWIAAVRCAGEREPTPDAGQPGPDASSGIEDATAGGLEDATAGGLEDATLGDPVFGPEPTADVTPRAPKQVPATDRGVAYDSVYFPPDHPHDQIAADMAFFRSQGVTTVYMTATERDLADDRKIRGVIAGARAAGLRVFMNPYVAGVFSFNETDAASVYLAQHPSHVSVSRLGGSERVPSIHFPELRAYVKDVLVRSLSYDFDGLLLDEPWYPIAPSGDYYPHDSAAQAQFRAMFGHDMPETETASVVRFRQVTMASFLGELIAHVHERRPYAITALVVLPHHEGLVDQHGTSDWRTLSRLPGLDVFEIDPYWYPTLTWEWFLANMDRFEVMTAGAAVRRGIWVRAYGLDGGYERISQTLEHLRRRGIPWLASWVTPIVPNADEAAAWAEIARVYRQP